MGRDTCFALVSASGVRGRWEAYDGVPILSHALSTSLPRGFFAPLDLPLGEFGREFAVEELREWVEGMASEGRAVPAELVPPGQRGPKEAKLPAFRQPDTLLGLFQLVDSFNGALPDELALRLFLEYVIAEAEKHGAPRVRLLRE